jgi:DNA-binding NarL/FixJ family response regulator
VSAIRVVIADDHELFRSGLRMLLESMPGVEVVAEAADGHEVLRVVERLRPRVVLMDIAMPGLNGLEAAARIAKEHPATRVVVVSMHGSEQYAIRALRAGAAGYLLKDASRAELELALTSVARGDIYLSPAMSRHVIADYRQRLDETAEAEPAPDPLTRLTPRQREVLQLVAEGHSTKEIATRLKLGVRTIETHRAQLMERLGIHDVPGLVRFAIRTGLVSPGP